MTQASTGSAWHGGTPPTLNPPADAIHPGRWRAGYLLYAMHHRDPSVGACVNCGSPARHCEFWLLGYTAMRLALADPSSLPEQPG